MNNNTSFAKQLIIYLILALVIGFLFISLAITNSLKHFIENNAYNQAKIIASNVLIIFEREISRIEGIPQNVTDMQGKLDYENISELPVRILKSHPSLIGSSIHYDTRNPAVAHIPHVTAFRSEDGRIHFTPPAMHCDFHRPDSSRIIRRSPNAGYWIYSAVNTTRTIAYCQPIYNEKQQACGVLKIDFPLKTITDIICSYKLFQSGNLFITDSQGHYIFHPDSKVLKTQTIMTHFSEGHSEKITRKILRGESGATCIYLDQTKHYLYYTPIDLMGWRLGIICPYSNILHSSAKLYYLLFIILGLGLFFLFIGIINIVRRLSSPLDELAFFARRLAEGQFNIELPTPKCSKEIQELYDSFHYLQLNLNNYIERLKMTTAEKEQLNSEMRLARRIQQRFLPKSITLPSHIQLAAELRQCREVGGDLYEFFLIGRLLYFAIGDVSGKGTPAALYMASICKLFHYVASHYPSTAAICNIINKHMCDDGEDDMYVTMFLGILDIDTGTMTFTNAGHPYPIIIHENGETGFLDKYPDVPIGVLEDHIFNEHTYTFPENTTLLFYTDGITEAENVFGQFYGQEKMIRSIRSDIEKTPTVLIESILKDICRHIDKGKQSDDLTLLAIHYTDPTQANS